MGPCAEADPLGLGEHHLRLAGRHLAARDAPAREVPERDLQDLDRLTGIGLDLILERERVRGALSAAEFSPPPRGRRSGRGRWILRPFSPEGYHRPVKKPSVSA